MCIRDSPWTGSENSANVNWSDDERLKGLKDKWYGKALVGDGAEAVERDDLDAWQKFAHDIVAQERSATSKPLRLMLLGTAGTGKSRTVRSFVRTKRTEVQRQWEQHVFRAELAKRSKEESMARKTDKSRSVSDVATRNVLEMLGVSKDDAAMAAAVAKHVRSGSSSSAATSKQKQTYDRIVGQMQEDVKNCCALSAPTGCASFQLRFGASTLHRTFGVPVLSLIHI